MLSTININIEGYWREKHRTGITSLPGIFFVYESKHNPATDTISLFRVIYVGEADNVRERINAHPLYSSWKNFVHDGNELSFATAYVDGKKRTQAKAGFIFHLKPLANTNYKDVFPFEKTVITVSGKTNLISTSFEILGHE